MNLIIENQYFGSVDYFINSIEFSHWTIELYERWEKSLHLNRCHVLGPNGPLLLSVPLEHGRGQRTLLKDVKISYRENWSLRHWRSLHDAYRRSPWFEHYAYSLEPLFRERPVFLMDWNSMTLDWVLRQLKWQGEIRQTDALRGEYPQAGFVDKRRAYRGDPVPGSSVSYAYAQVFSERHGFVGNLSILDLLFCEGPGARGLLGMGDK
jgi:hypothetical protein